MARTADLNLASFGDVKRVEKSVVVETSSSISHDRFGLFVFGIS